MSREAVLTDTQWARIEPLMASSDGVKSRPFRDYRQVVEGIIYQFRTGVAWRDLPSVFGPWQTVWKRHHPFSVDRTRTKPDRVMGDKAYSSQANRAILRGRGIEAVISEPSDQAGHRRRNTVEGSFNDHKQWRGIATRYDKLALTYRGGVVLRAITLWLRTYETRPSCLLTALVLDRLRPLSVGP